MKGDWLDQIVDIRDEVTNRECLQMYAGPAMFKAIERFETWWDAYGHNHFDGAPACVSALREAAALARGES